MGSLEYTMQLSNSSQLEQRRELTKLRNRGQDFTRVSKTRLERAVDLTFSFSFLIGR